MCSSAGPICGGLRGGVRLGSAGACDTVAWGVQRVGLQRPHGWLSLSASRRCLTRAGEREQGGLEPAVGKYEEGLRGVKRSTWLPRECGVEAGRGRSPRRKGVSSLQRRRQCPWVPWHLWTARMEETRTTGVHMSATTPHAGRLGGGWRYKAPPSPCVRVRVSGVSLPPG